MSEFLEPMESDRYGRLLQELATRAKPTNEMTTLEWAEIQALEALEKAEHAKARVLYVRCTGKTPEEG